MYIEDPLGNNYTDFQCSAQSFGVLSVLLASDFIWQHPSIVTSYGGRRRARWHVFNFWTEKCMCSRHPTLGRSHREVPGDLVSAKWEEGKWGCMQAPPLTSTSGSHRRSIQGFFSPTWEFEHVRGKMANPIPPLSYSSRFLPAGVKMHVCLDSWLCVESIHEHDLGLFTDSTLKLWTHNDRQGMLGTPSKNLHGTRYKNSWMGLQNRNRSPALSRFLIMGASQAYSDKGAYKLLSRSFCLNFWVTSRWRWGRLIQTLQSLPHLALIIFTGITLNGPTVFHPKIQFTERSPLENTNTCRSSFVDTSMKVFSGCGRCTHTW